MDDGTLAYLRKVERRHTDIRVVALPRNRGKGRTVAGGVRRTTGDLVLVTDADLSTPIDEMANRLRARLAEQGWIPESWPGGT